jgi:hypothetical protein
MSRQYLVLRDGLDVPELMERVEDALDELHQPRRTVFAYRDAEERENAAVRTWTERRRRESAIQLVDDREIPARYLVVEAKTPTDAKRLAAELRRHLPVVPIDDLRERARQTVKHDPQSLVRLALGASEDYDRKTFEILRSALQDPSPSVRGAAVFAAGVTQWPQWIAELKSLSEKDPDPSIRQAAEQVLQTYELRAANRESASGRPEGDRGEQNR